MRIDYVFSIIKITKEVFKDMMKIELKENSPIILKEKKFSDYNVSINFNGDLKGCLILIIDKKTALEFTESFIEEGKVEENDIEEVLEELIKKIALSFKKETKLYIDLSKENFQKSNFNYYNGISFIEFGFEAKESFFSIIVGLENNIASI